MSKCSEFFLLNFFFFFRPDLFFFRDHQFRPSQLVTRGWGDWQGQTLGGTAELPYLWMQCTVRLCCV